MEQSAYSLDPTQLKFVGGQHSAQRWVNIVLGYQNVLEAHPAKAWLLYEPDSFVFSALFFALLAAGKSIVLPQNAQEEHILSVKELTQASIGSSQIEPHLLSHADWPTANITKLTIPADAEICFLTSGSTGQAKIIRKCYRQLQVEVDALESLYAEQVTGSTFVSTISHQHIYGLLFKLLWPLTKGHGLISQAFEYPENIVNAVRKENLALITLVASPAHLQRLCLDNVLRDVREHIQLIFSSGGPLDADKNMQLQEQLGCEVAEIYGSTETGGIAWRKRTSANDDLWRTFSGISIGYQNNSDLLKLSSPYILQENFLADDRVEIIGPTMFRLLGRADSVVKIEEKRVSLDEIQARLKQHHYVDDAYVLVISASRKQLAALIVLNPAGIEASDKLPKFQFNAIFKSFLAKWFEPVLLPKKFRYPHELPYNAQGKLSRKDLESNFE